jgi:tetratricopeptide (TPR) repeat protein
MFDVLKQLGKDHVERIDDNVGREIAKAAGVDALVSASIRKFGRLYSIDLKVLDPRKDEYLLTAKEEGEGQESIPQMLDRLSEKTRIGLKEKAEEVRELQQSVATVTTSNLEAYQHYFRGEELINRLKFTEAEEELRKAVALDTSFGLAYYRLAYAITWFDDAGARDPIARALRHIDRIPEREQYLLRAEDVRGRLGMEEAIDVLKEMERHYPDDKEMLYGIGDYSYHLGRFDEALNYFTRVLSIDSHFERALQHLAWTHRDLGRYDQMLETAKKYVSVSGSGGAYAILGSAYALTGRHKEGLETLRQAQQLFPDSWEITIAIVTLSLDKGDVATADLESKGLMSQDNTPFVRRRGIDLQADILVYQGKVKEARSLLRQSMALSLQLGDSTSAGQSISQAAALTLLLHNDVDKAWEELQEATKYHRYSSSSTFKGWLAYFAILRGDMAMAERVMPKDPEWFRQTQLTIGSINQGNCTDGERLRADDKSWRLLPEGFRQYVLYDLVKCHLANGGYDKALSALQEMQSSGRRSESVSTYPRSFYQEGKAHEGKGDAGRAREAYEKFLSIWKDADRDLPDYQDAQARLAKLRKNA